MHGGRRKTYGIWHVVEYSVLGFLMAGSVFNLDLRFSKRFLFILVVTLSTLYGLSDEIHQSFVPGRDADLGDVMADGVGSLIGAFCYSKLLLKVRQDE